jgi:hypothetical protein
MELGAHFYAAVRSPGGGRAVVCHVPALFPITRSQHGTLYLITVLVRHIPYIPVLPICLPVTVS